MSTGPKPPKTLGDLLYTEATPQASEKDWVALVKAIAAGDQQALRVLYDSTHRLVYTLSLRITGNASAAEEVTLDVFHDVWRRAAAYNSVAGSVIGWIMNQARSRAIDRVRFEQRQKRVNPFPHAPLPAASVLDPVEKLDLLHHGRALREALKVLAPEERRAIEATFFSEQTYQEAATQLQQPLGTVKTRIRSALGKLRRCLAIEQEP